MQSRVTISGNIVSELSEKIPSNIIALNELIKNAYDAGAPSVEVSLDSTKKKLIIKDTGEGMNKSDIDTLFHISNSNKIYGSLNKKYNRYVQGSKGLGFLSVFKFGHKVQWETKKDKGYRFSLDYDSLVGQYDISECVIELIEDDSIEKGTKIEISIDDYNMNSLLDYFKEEKNYKKILNAFDDDTFDINIKIDGIVYKSSCTENYILYKRDVLGLLKELPSRIFDISISSPPYGDNATTVPYGQFSMLDLYIIDKRDLELEGWELDNYSIIDRMSLGGNKKETKLGEFEKGLIKPYLDKISIEKQEKVIRFFNDYFVWLEGLCKVTDKFIVLTLGNRTVDRIKINLTEITQKYLESREFKNIEFAEREIPNKRTPKVTSMVDLKPVDSMTKEYIIVHERRK